MKPYPALIRELTAEICPSVDKKKFTTDDRAIPKNARIKTAANSIRTSRGSMNHPMNFTYPRHIPVETKHIIRVDTREAQTYPAEITAGFAGVTAMSLTAPLALS